MSPLSKDNDLKESLLDSTKGDKSVVTQQKGSSTESKSRFGFRLFSKNKKEEPIADALEEAEQYKRRQQWSEPLLGKKDAIEDKKPRGPGGSS